MGLSDRWRRLPGFVLGLCAGFAFKDIGLRGVVSYWGPVAPLVPLFGVLCGLAWTTRLRRVVIAAVWAVLALWMVVMFTPLTRWMMGGLVRRDALREGDAIFVLSSNVQPDDDPSPAALARATRGLELLGEGEAPRLYLSELPSPAGSYVRYLKTSAQRMGVPHPEAIFSVGLVGNTHDEAMRVAALFARNGWKRLLLVTSPTHSRRAAATFERAGVPEVVSVPSSETMFDAEKLKVSDEKGNAFGVEIHEWVGMLVYRLRGWI